MNSNSSPIYCLDTSAFVDIVHDQPEDSYPGLWNCMGDLAKAGRLIMIKNAYDECKDQEAQPWLKASSSIIRLLTADIQECVSTLQLYLSIEKGPTAITQMGTTWMPKDSAY